MGDMVSLKIDPSTILWRGVDRPATGNIHLDVSGHAFPRTTMPLTRANRRKFTARTAGVLVIESPLTRVFDESLLAATGKVLGRCQREGWSSRDVDYLEQVGTTARSVSQPTWVRSWARG